MSEAADKLRQDICELFAKRARGDLTEKRFQKRLTEASVALCRCVAADRFEADEPVLAECHVVHAHIKLAQSILQEPEQEAVSLFVSSRRLVRVRSIIVPHRPITCDEADGTVIDQMALQEVGRMVLHRQFRWGEAATGLVAILLAWGLGDLLQVTGPFLMLLGGAGILHALLLPTRFVELVPRGPAHEPPFLLHALRKRDVRAVLAVIRKGCT
jgi:hypothetical protein